MIVTQPTLINYVNGGLPQTVDSLLASFPASAAYRGMYARVSDYGGYVDRVLRCDYDVGLDYYFWNPTQREYARSVAITADTTFLPLKAPTPIVLTGTVPVGVTRTVTLGTLNGGPGQVWEVRSALTQMLGTLNIAGTGLGSAIALVLGGYQKYVIDGSSGSLQLVRLV